MSALPFRFALAAAVFCATPAAAQRPVPLEAADCSRVNASFGNRPVAHAVRYLTVPHSVGLLNVRPDSNGGVRVERGAGPNYTITACITASDAYESDAQQAADAVQLSVTGSNVRVDNGRSAAQLSVQLIVEAPDGARLRVETTNGPIGVTGVSGDISAHAANGPIGLEHLSGRIVARAQNGPIQVVGHQGELDVAATNGPIAVRLTGDRWDGHLTARTQNGPIAVDVPGRYGSGVEISSSGSSPWMCRLAACAEARTVSDDRRTVRVGTDPVVVHISTNNGPVTVRER